MHKRLSKLLSLYGLFCMLTGFGAYMTNREKAQSALSAVVLGLLAQVVAGPMRRGEQWALLASISLVAVATISFGIQTIKYWISYASGDEHKFFAAISVTILWVGILPLFPSFYRAAQRQLRFKNILFKDKSDSTEVE